MSRCDLHAPAATHSVAGTATCASPRCDRDGFHAGRAPGVLGWLRDLTNPGTAMNDDLVFEKFFRQQLDEGMSLAEGSDLLTLLPFPGHRFIAQFCCRGLALEEGTGKIMEQNLWAIGIHFPPDYLRRPVDVAEVLTYLGPAREPWHVNIRPPHICMHIAPGAPLVEILYGLFDLLTWAVYSTEQNGLNGDCAQWARHQDPKRFPLEKRPLRRRRIAFQVEPLGKVTPS